MFGEMYNEMLERIDDQIKRTEEIRSDFIKAIKKYKASGEKDEEIDARINFAYEDGYLKGLEASKAILDSYYDRIW